MMKTDSGLGIRLALAHGTERDAICRARHDVYATELGQYEAQANGLLRDPPDANSLYIAAYVAGRMIGFVGITPPGSPRFSVDKYLRREEIPFPFDEHLFEIRALTVLRAARGSLAAGLLMYAAFRWVQAHGGTRIVAIGRREVLDMYLRVGMKRVGRSFSCGAVTYELISAEVGEVAASLRRFDGRLRRLEHRVDWRLGIAFRRVPECYHGGAFFDAIGDEFDDLRRRERVISADVLDAWYPPAPAVREMLQEHLDWAMRTSPPTHAEGLRRTIARVRGVEPDCVLPGAGSSQLIFLALRHWLSPASRVLILDPTYGEYAHVLDKIIGCRVERLALAREGGYRLDPERLARKLREGFDLFVWVNPNNPTGRHLPRSEAAAVLAEASPVTRVWVDETYVEYAGPDQSLESFAVRSENVVVCKSLSKVCALSGLRAGYLCGPRHLFEDLRALTPPWSISLPAQMAAILALRDPEYYAARYRETHALREQLTNALAEIGIHEIVPGVGNFIMFHLAADGPDAATVVRECRQRGLFLRDFAGMQASLGRHALRIAVKDAATNRRMLGILRTVLGGGEAGDEVAARSSQAEEPGALTLVEA